MLDRIKKAGLPSSNRSKECLLWRLEFATLTTLRRVLSSALVTNVRAHGLFCLRRRFLGDQNIVLHSGAVRVRTQHGSFGLPCTKEIPAWLLTPWISAL